MFRSKAAEQPLIRVIRAVLGREARVNRRFHLWRGYGVAGRLLQINISQQFFVILERSDRI